MKNDINFMSYENLNKLLEKHKKENYPYKKYEFDSTSYTLLLCDINSLIKEKQKLVKYLENKIEELHKEYGNWIYDKDYQENGLYEAYQDILERVRSGKYE